MENDRRETEGTERTPGTDLYQDADFYIGCGPRETRGCYFEIHGSILSEIVFGKASIEVSPPSDVMKVRICEKYYGHDLSPAWPDVKDKIFTIVIEHPFCPIVRESEILPRIDPEFNDQGECFIDLKKEFPNATPS